MKAAEFKWGPLSVKQRKILSWWTDWSPYKDFDGIIADGAIRSGKTVSMAFSYALWAMETFSGCYFAICGKTIGSVRRNVTNNLKRQLAARGYAVQEHRGDENFIEISKGNRSNRFYLFSGKDERSQDLIQGTTLAGAFFDEVALMPESFVNQATARCSVDGSKFWFNCNPEGPQHYFYKDWILRCRDRRLVYLHFTMEDNLTLTQRVRERYEAQYSGVFYQRFISGLWVMADGLIYDSFSRDAHVLRTEPETEGDYYVSSDFGIQNATVFLLWRRVKRTDKWVCLQEWYYSGRDNKAQKTVQELVQGMESILPRDGSGEIIEPYQVIVDPSAAALILELRRKGYRTRQAVNDVLNGISDVSTMLRKEQLLFMERCRSTINEFGVYAWDPKAAEHGVDQPIKQNDHAMDATRYFVETLRLVRRAR